MIFFSVHSRDTLIQQILKIHFTTYLLPFFHFILFIHFSGETFVKQNVCIILKRSFKFQNQYS